MTAVPRIPAEFRCERAGRPHHLAVPLDEHYIPGGSHSDGRITLGGRTLVTTEGGKRREQSLADDAAVLAAYRDQFGIRLARAPGLRNG